MFADEIFMRDALSLALGGWGKTNPNPYVGAVIVKEGRIIASGYHGEQKQDHAEVIALKKAGEKSKGACLYVNLEPCSHFGRTPPCVKAIVASGIKRVVVAMVDPNPLIQGAGLEYLGRAGIELEVGVLEKEARQLNEIFLKYIACDRPFMLLKGAVSLDGKIATINNDSQWISGESSRRHAHILRHRFSAIMVGINTILHDNPRLTSRLPNNLGRNPIKIIVDSKGRIPLNSNVFETSRRNGIILASTSQLPSRKEAALVARGVRIIKRETSEGRVDLGQLVKEVHKIGIDSILLEGGGELNYSALEAGLVDKVALYLAPKIIGGKEAPSFVGGQGFPTINEAIDLKDVNIRCLGEDYLLEAYLK